jgi:hypothetical protein
LPWAIFLSSLRDEEPQRGAEAWGHFFFLSSLRDEGSALADLTADVAMLICEAKPLLCRATKESRQVKRTLISIGKLALVLLAGVVGGMVGRGHSSGSSVHAQEKAIEPANCMVAVPKSWGEYKGASAYGLAFEDQNGTLRYLLHPTCGNLNSPTDNPYVDLEVLRR